MLRLITVLCLINLNFGSCLDIIHDLLGRNYITELLPWEFFDALRRRRKPNSLSLNMNVLAGALKKIDNTLVVASFGLDCSKLFCSDAIFVDMTVHQSKDDILRKWFPKPPVIQVAPSQVGSVEVGGSSSCSGVLSANDSEGGKSSKLSPSDSSLVKETDVADETQGEAEYSHSKDEGNSISKVSAEKQRVAEDSHTEGEENCASSESNPTCQQDANASTPSSSKEAGSKAKNKTKGKNKKNKKKGGRK